MNLTEYLLTCLAEEASEVAHATCKALRFTPGERLNNGPSNAERVAIEIVDLLAVVGLLQDSGVINEPSMAAALIDKKREKISRYMRYSQSLGALAYDHISTREFTDEQLLQELATRHGMAEWDGGEARYGSGYEVMIPAGCDSTVSLIVNKDAKDYLDRHFDPHGQKES